MIFLGPNRQKAFRKIARDLSVRETYVNKNYTIYTKITLIGDERNRLEAVKKMKDIERCIRVLKYIHCGFCLREGHDEDQCPNCSVCTKTGHTFKDCPERNLFVPFQPSASTGPLTNEFAVMRQRDHQLLIEQNPRKYRNLTPKEAAIAKYNINTDAWWKLNAPRTRFRWACKYYAIDLENCCAMQGSSGNPVAYVALSGYVDKDCGFMLKYGTYVDTSDHSSGVGGDVHTIGPVQVEKGVSKETVRSELLPILQDEHTVVVFTHGGIDDLTGVGILESEINLLNLVGPSLDIVSGLINVLPLSQIHGGYKNGVYCTPKLRDMVFAYSNGETRIQEFDNKMRAFPGHNPEIDARNTGKIGYKIFFRDGDKVNRLTYSQIFKKVQAFLHSEEGKTMKLNLADRKKYDKHHIVADEPLYGYRFE